MRKEVKKEKPGSVFLRAFIFFGVLPVIFAALSACASSGSSMIDEDELAFPLEVPSPQDVVYNGRPQRISYTYEGEGRPEIIYYLSSSDLAEDRRGSRAEPVNSGTYYVRLIRPSKGRNTPPREFYAVLNILKQPVRIRVLRKQEAIYNGDPKRVEAVSEPYKPLAFSYFPNQELLEAAKKTSADTPPGQSVTITHTFKGYRRIDMAPSEQGTYYVWIYYPGDRNYQSASVEVEFTILPAK